MDVRMIAALARHDLRARYAGSALGAAWAFISPVVTVLIYTFVFQVAFRSGEAGGAPYLLWLVAGIAPWFFFSEGLSGVTSALSDYSYLVKKMKFRVEYLPVIRVASALFVHLFFILLVFLVSAAFGAAPRPANLQVFYYLICAAVFVYALGRITVACNTYFKDAGGVVNVAVQLLFWLTPIFWDIENLSGGLKRFFSLSPVYYLVQGYRDAFVYGVWPSEHLPGALCFWGITLLLLLAGGPFFRRARRDAPDLI